MQGSTISWRYAQALFAVALEQQIIARVEQDLLTVQTILSSDPQIQLVWQHPQIGAGDKVAVIEKLAEGDLSPVSRNLLVLLAEKRRVRYFDQVLAAYLELARREEGVLPVRAIVAAALDADQEQQLTDKLSAQYQKKVALVQTVDPNILGGVILRIGDQVTDGSLRRRLEQIKESFIQQVR